MPFFLEKSQARHGTAQLMKNRYRKGRAQAAAPAVKSNPPNRRAPMAKRWLSPGVEHARSRRCTSVACSVLRPAADLQISASSRDDGSSSSPDGRAGSKTEYDFGACA